MRRFKRLATPLPGANPEMGPFSDAHSTTYTVLGASFIFIIISVSGKSRRFPLFSKKIFVLYPFIQYLLSKMPHPVTKAVYPGSFDPITLGHLDIMNRASRLFDHLIIGIGNNLEKSSLFTSEERRNLIAEATADLPNLEIQIFSGLAVDFVKDCGARIMIRGVRPITDIQAELTMMMANRRLSPDVETLMMIADGELAHVSSSLIKQIAHLARNEELSRFLPPNVVEAVRKKIPLRKTGNGKQEDELPFE